MIQNEASIHIIFLNTVLSEAHFIAYLSIRYDKMLIQDHILKYAIIQCFVLVHILKYDIKRASISSISKNIAEYEDNSRSYFEIYYRSILHFIAYVKIYSSLVDHLKAYQEIRYNPKQIIRAYLKIQH